MARQKDNRRLWRWCALLGLGFFSGCFGGAIGTVLVDVWIYSEPLAQALRLSFSDLLTMMGGGIGGGLGFWIVFRLREISEESNHTG